MDIIKHNAIIISAIIISTFILIFISNHIFSIDIIYNNQEIVDLVKKELSKYDIKKYHRKKTYEYLTMVKENILKDNKDVLEWLEIEENGTKYIVKLVERKQQTKPQKYTYQSVVAKKDAIISSIYAYAGEKVKLENDYVKKGDVVISGILKKTDESNIYIQADGLVYGEIWYNIDIEYPIYYQEEKLTGKSMQTISLYLLGKRIPIFPYKKYKHFNYKNKLVIENNVVPFKIVKEKLYEVEIIEEIYTDEEIVTRASALAAKKLKENNNDIIEIKDIQVLNKKVTNSKVKLQLFTSAIENITNIKEEIPVEN